MLKQSHESVYKSLHGKLAVTADRVELAAKKYRRWILFTQNLSVGFSFCSWLPQKRFRCVIQQEVEMRTRHRNRSCENGAKSEEFINTNAIK